MILRNPSLLARLLLLPLALLLPAPQAPAADSAGPATLHLSFDDFGFLEQDFVARGGHKTIEERGLTLEEGRFGQGLRMNLTPHIDLRDEMSGADLDEVVAVIFRTWRHREHWTVDNQPFLWGAGRFNTGSGAVALWVKGKLTEGELFNQSATAWGRAEKPCWRSPPAPTSASPPISWTPATSATRSAPRRSGTRTAGTTWSSTGTGPGAWS